MTPGVMFENPRGGMGSATIKVRGFASSKVGFYLDGIPIMNGYDRGTDYSHFVTQGIGGIQISKGFTSPIYGINAMGGAVNIISVKPKKELELYLRQKLIFGRHSSPDEVQQGFSIGSNQGTYYFQADVSHTNRSTYPLSNEFKGTLVQPKGDQRNAFYSNKTAKLKFGIQPNENHEYSLSYIYLRGEKEGRFPEAGGPQWRFPHYDRDIIYLLGSSYFTPDLSLNTRLYYDSSSQKRTHGLCIRADGSLSLGYNNPNNTEPRCDPTKGHFFDDDTIGAIFTLSYDLNQNSNAKFGVNVKKDHHTAESTMANTTSEDLEELTSSVFIQYAQRISVFRFIVATSYDRLDALNAYNYDSSKTPNESKEKTKIKGNFSLQGIVYYDISQAQTLHLAIGKKQNLPTMSSRYGNTIWGTYAQNTGLKPESIINYEIGYNLNFGSTNLSAALFYNDKTDMVVRTSVIGGCSNPTNGMCYKNVNADTGYTYGGEIAFEQGFFNNDALIIGANYSYIQEKAEGSAVSRAGTRITSYPNHMFNAKIAVKPISKLEFVGLSTLESPKYWAYGASYYKDPNYFTLDIKANYEIDKGFSVNVGVLNLTDRDNFTWWETPRARLHFAGRRWFAGFEYQY